VDAYLTALFTYFERIVGYSQDSRSIVDFDVEEWPITLSMRTMTNENMHHLQDAQARNIMLSATRVQVVNLPESQTTPRLLGHPDGACVISANKCFGHGPSGTQEEMNVGSTPEAYPVVLLAPPLSDHKVLVCRGAEAMVSIIGYGRDARLGDLLPQSAANLHDGLWWRMRTMLFMDALELDTLPVEEDCPIPDICPSSRLSRDMILKAYNAFSSGTYGHVSTGLWGCGTFGGNRYVKCILQWCAAALAGVPELRFVFSTAEQHAFAEELAQLSMELQVKCVSVYRMFNILVELKDTPGVGPDGIFTYIGQRISALT
jgi:poly(ADP-ribose) glycohydrolase